MLPRLQLLVSTFYSASVKCTEKEWYNFFYYLEASKETINYLANTYCSWEEHDLHEKGFIQEDSLLMYATLVEGNSPRNLITIIKGPASARIVTTPILYLEKGTPFKYFIGPDPKEESDILIYENPKIRKGVFMVRRIERVKI